MTTGNTPADMDLGDGGDGDDDDATGGKGEKKKKNTYKHLIKGIPGVLILIFAALHSFLNTFKSGKHSLKKDDSLTKVMLVPPKQRMRIAHFDLRTQEEAFTVSLEGLKGVRFLLSLPISNLKFHFKWNINTLVLESAQAREDRKKRVTFVHSSLYDTILNPLSSIISLISLRYNRKSSKDSPSYKHNMVDLYLKHRRHRTNNNINHILHRHLLDLHLRPLTLSPYMHLYPRLPQLQVRLCHQEGRPHRFLNAVEPLILVQTHLVLLLSPRRTEHLLGRQQDQDLP